MKYLATAIALWTFVGLSAFAEETPPTTDKKEERRGARRGRERFRVVSTGQDGWRYLDTQKRPAETWVQPDFDDSQWKQGRAPLGYGEDDVATKLSYGDDSELKFPAAFFRRKFNVSEVAEAYAGRIRADDSAVVYLNGKEVHRLRMPEGEIDHAVYSGEILSSTADRDSERELVFFKIDPETIVKGENVLCVSVHQGHARSSDLILDMELLGVSKEQLERFEKRAKSGRMTNRRAYTNRRRLEVKDPAAFAKTQEKVIFSGPQTGEELPSFKATGLRADSDGKEFDAVALANGKPQILIFQDETGVGLRGLLSLTRMLATVDEKSAQELHATTIFLGDDPGKITRTAKNVERYISSDLLIGLSRDGRDGPGSYGLNRSVSQTIIFAKAGKVTHNFVFPQGMLYPDPHVLGALASVMGEELATVEKWLNEAPAGRGNMRRGARQRPQRDE